MSSSLADLQKERGFPHPSRKKKLLKFKRESTCSQANPEANNTAYSYTYDTDSTCTTPNNQGDLLKRVDAVGNVTCYVHDGIHRLTGVTYPSGSYASVTP